VKKRHPQVAVIGNGDVKCAPDAQRMIDKTGCDGVMIGRGALGQPWIFRDTAYFLATGQEAAPLSQVERIALVRAHFEHLLRWRGERVAVNTLRRRISWYSPHLQPWPGLRRDVQAIDCAAGFLDFLSQRVAHITDGCDELRAGRGEAGAALNAS
jgi:tRNA-dihydrouridine synthase